ncbi:coiled-coil-helix-coiled-coil-helix domain-containing protein 1 [Dunckerocampus dactyliophorus]|uniref:coiled-coil-helix-coiled-coil-helix domain-containing protein 1 n=1 Tax=Dunckerocampus dactyliophorus TaxID=161453 RepID=UPI0024075AA9|nr:coiled-coil-helix-coiled-coil-helix domain-containing protein 1 [Dunckerocampus dactyliophorus]
MAAQGATLLQHKVSRLLSKENGKPVLKPNKPLILKDGVANRKPKKGEATCVTELSVMMACWKQNNFVDSLCSKEMGDFHKCVQKTRAARKDTSGQTTLSGGHLPPKQATTLLKRYPNILSEI